MIAFARKLPEPDEELRPIVRSILEVLNAIVVAFTAGKNRYAKKGRYAVYVGHVAPGHEPKSPTELPSGLATAFILFAPTSPAFGQRFCRAYNQRQLDNGIPGHRWAMLALRPKSTLEPCQGEDLAASELLKAIPLVTSADGNDVAGGVL